MAYLAYRYSSDDGNTYQIVLPSEFADSLNYILADGSEPYLPTYISPRYVTYQSATPALWLSAVFTYPYSLLGAPQQIDIDGTIYVLKSSYGEQRGNTGDNNIMTVAGPQGPRGADGADGPEGPPGADGTNADIQTATGDISSSAILNSVSSKVQIVAAQGSGKTIVPVQWVFKLNNDGSAYTVSGGASFFSGSTSLINMAGSILNTAPPRWQWTTMGTLNDGNDRTNQPLNWGVVTSVSGGTATLSYNVDYRVISL